MIADKIKNARTIKKLTQEQVAEDLNVSRQTISNWEMGVSVPNINTLILISEKFDIPVDEMLKSGDVVEKIDNNKTPFKKDRNRRLRNATSRMNTAFFCYEKQITPHWIWYNRVD